jgi:hypothetical protein
MKLSSLKCCSNDYIILVKHEISLGNNLIRRMEEKISFLFPVNYWFLANEENYWGWDQLIIIVRG